MIAKFKIFKKIPSKSNLDVEEEHEYWNMECEKLILARSTKSTS
jgi:hypothetical protein